MNIVAFTLLLAFFLAAQDKPPQKCSLSGSVVNSASGEPLNRAEIFAEPVLGGTVATTTTDAKGNFTLVNLDPGEYNLKGRRNGYLDSFYGARRAESKGTTIALDPGAEMKDIQLKLVPFAVLAGTVRETDGEPLAGARVAVFAATYEEGRRRLDQVDDTHTDDQGQYESPTWSPANTISARSRIATTNIVRWSKTIRARRACLNIASSALPQHRDPAAARPMRSPPASRITGSGTSHCREAACFRHLRPPRRACRNQWQRHPLRPAPD